MGLSISSGPLSRQASEEVNYRIDGPEHLLFFGDFPRRVRAAFADAVVLDTTRGRLLHETGLLPVLYVPDEDVAASVLRPTEHSTHCPYKGDASYWTVKVSDRTAENAVWSYPEPIRSADWLRGYRAFSWDAMDAWYDEDEQVYGHLRDPYHRVDVRASSRRVRVVVEGEVLAESTRAKVLSETGLPNRYYLPCEDVHVRCGGVRRRWFVPTRAPRPTGPRLRWATWPGPTRNRSRTQPRSLRMCASSTTTSRSRSTDERGR